MKAVCFIFLFLFCSLSSYAQVIGFEEKVPETFKVSGKGEVKLSSLFYKEGESSLEWDFQPASTLDVQIEPLSLNAKKEQQFGITLWIYNEKPQQDSIRFEFLNKAGEVSYWFTYHLQAAGWRACWISFAYMNGDKKDKNIVSYRLVAPDRKGRIFLDRLTFPEKKMNLRTTPDQQLPANNGLSNRDLWHWCLVWKWEQQSYDVPLLSKLTTRQKKDLKTIEQRLTEFLDVKKAPQGKTRRKGRCHGMISKRCLLVLHTMPSTIRMRHRRRTILPYSTMQWIRDSLLAAAWGRIIITAIRYVKYILPPGSCGTRFINILTGMPIYPLYVSGLLYRRLVNRVRRSGMNYWIHGIRS